MPVNKTLEELGFTKREIEFWQVVLRFGEIQLSEVAKRMSIPRTSAYTVAQSLLNKGLVGFYTKRGKRFFVPSPPERLADLFDDRSKKAHALAALLKKHQGRGERVPRVRVFEGEQGARQVLQEVLGQRKHFSAMTSVEDMEAIFGHYLEEFIEQRVRQRLRIRFITNRTPKSIQLAEKDPDEFRETRFVPAAFRFETANFIHPNRVTMLSLKERPFGLIIEDRYIASTQQMYFDLLWILLGKKDR